ncbi:MAG: hypothetical protein II324_01280 [Selenomonadales bacterium]|nr:hypothetical protein [Selenomonadales bacterium]MBQ2245662.1 hypothetical protein [Selenomonadales bacterium]
MMIRSLFVILLMIGLMMPCAWAEEASAKSSPLSKVTIESDEWMEGDTYHIRYTFTNPTDEVIEETVLRTNVLLYTHDRAPYSPAITKRDPAPEWVLRVEPHSSTTHTITFPKEPAFTFYP